MISTSNIKRPAKKAQKSSSLEELMNKDFQLMGSGFGDKQKELFFTELYILTTSGIDIKSALELMLVEEGNKKNLVVTENLIKSIIGGVPLSGAMAKEKVFSLYEINSIRIGEETGRLDFVLKEVSKFYGNKIKQRQKLVQALTYPLMVLFVAFIAILFMLKFIVPMFADTFKRFGGELPAITRFTIALSHVLGNVFLYGILMAASSVIVIYTNRNKSWVRRFLAGVILTIPIVNKIVILNTLVKVSRTMSLLLHSKVPLLQAIELTLNMVNFYPVVDSFKAAHSGLVKGESLNSTLGNHKIYPRRFITLLKVGEETNKLDSMFENLAEQYSTELEHRVSLLSSVLEPAMIIFLGLIVGFILIAMYLPLFQLSSTIQ